MTPATPLVIVAAVLLPPLGVFLARGMGTRFWIALALTLLGWLPGMLYALYVVLIEPRRPGPSSPASTPGDRPRP